MSQIVVGITTLFQQPSRYGWDPQRGHWAVWEWEAAGSQGKLNCRALGAQLAAGNVQYEVDESFGKARVTATFGSDPNVPSSAETPIISWSTQTNRVPKEIFQIGKVFAFRNTTDFPVVVANGLTNALLVLRKCVEEKSLSAATDAGINITGIDPTWDDWLEAYDLAVSGYTEDVVEQSVIIRTSTASANYARTILVENTGKIFTPAQMLALESAPATIIETVALPDGLTPFNPATPGFGFLYGYRKSKPDMQPAAFNKWTVTTQWEQGVWSMFMKDPAA